MNKGRLIVLSGPSGVGKNTIRKKLFEDESLNIKFAISHTTRKPRKHEKDGVDYYFIEKDHFAMMVRDRLMIEHASFISNFYGTSRGEVNRILESGANCVLEIEVQGALQIMKKFENAITIFIAPPSFEALEKRLIERGTESIELIKNRTNQAKFELGLKERYQHVVINNDLENCVAKIVKIIKSI